MKAAYIRACILCLFLSLPGLVFSQLEMNNGTITLNNIAFSFEPMVSAINNNGDAETLFFSGYSVTNPDEQRIVFKNSKLNLSLHVTPKPNLGSSIWQVRVEVDYLENVSLRTSSLRVRWEQPALITAYLGADAIRKRDRSLNKDLCPYRDKIVEYATPDSSIWLIGSNFDGCTGVERIDRETVYSYDYRLHYGRLFDKNKRRFIRKPDLKPCLAGTSDSYSFLICGQNPDMPKINRWLGDNKAALSISNDADGTTINKIKALFFGSSIPTSPKYLTQGIIANNLKVSNSVFGRYVDSQSQVWSSLLAHGQTIGYHTYSNYGDFAAKIKYNLLQQMTPFNIRLWLDHGWSSNPEDFCRNATNPDSPYYLLDIINNCSIDYVWMGDEPASNEFNAFDAPWRLPHRVYEFAGLNKPVWFFGRTRMEAMHYFDDRHAVDMNHNLTRENLDKLLNDEGLCLIYTHFYFDDTASRRTFFETLPGYNYEIRDDGNAYFEMLNEYQTQHHLWVDTTESIFDRMIAMEQVRIVNISTFAEGYRTVTVENGSGYDLPDVLLDFGSEQVLIPLLTAGSRYTITQGINGDNCKPLLAENLFLYYNNSNLYIKSRDREYIPPLELRIYNIKGQKVLSTRKSSCNNATVIPVKGFSAGVYFAVVKPEDSRHFIRKFLVLP